MTPAPPQGDALVTVAMPCPFCGGEAELDNLIDDNDYFVSCKDCEVQQIANYSSEEAVIRWNQRANFPVPETRESHTSAAPQTHSTDDEAGEIAEWLQELSSGANFADKGDGWKLTTQGKIEREKSRRRLSILRALSRIPSEEATVDEDTVYIALLGTVGDELLSNILADLKSAGLRITRTPGGQT